jgi:Fe-S cluster biogenesis protein NfuA
MLVETVETPNPNSLKFIPNMTVSEIGPVEIFKDKKEDKKIPLANNILAIEGVTSIFFGDDFISVNKTGPVKWDDLKPGIISEINDFYSKGNKVVLKKKLENNDQQKEESEVVTKIKEVLESKIRPAVARDGGDIKFKSFNDGIVTVELQGSCSGCPSSIVTLKKGVENMLKHYVPEVNSVESI